MLSFFQFLPAEFAQHAPSLGVNRVNDLYRFIYKHKRSSFIGSAAYLNACSDYDFSLPAIKALQKSGDGTVKFLVGLTDNQSVEMVIIPFKNKFSVCLSSQVGCGMNCQFCHTGTQGLQRNLAVHEIIGQYKIAVDWLKNHHPEYRAYPNIVFMGQGEPLHNFENLKQAIAILKSDVGYNLGMRQICVSTAGYLPGLERFNELGCNIAFSLHSSFDEVRDTIIPINKKWPLHSLVKSFESIDYKNSQFLNIEYLVLQGVNHSESDAQNIKKIFGHLPLTINLIPFNPYPGSLWSRPTTFEVEQFADCLREQGIFTTIRTTKGDDILAACGQLKSKVDSHKMNDRFAKS
jgi:23S rRNA (adenine2503-C2)-methyltransferase